MISILNFNWEAMPWNYWVLEFNFSEKLTEQMLLALRMSVFL